MKIECKFVVVVFFAWLICTGFLIKCFFLGPVDTARTRGFETPSLAGYLRQATRAFDHSGATNGIVFRGEWKPEEVYVGGDFVHHRGYYFVTDNGMEWFNVFFSREGFSFILKNQGDFLFHIKDSDGDER